MSPLEPLVGMTLSEVRKAGRFAWFRHDAQRTVVVWTPETDAVAFLSADGSYKEKVIQYGGPLDHWHHLPGCDCEFCQSRCTVCGAPMGPKGCTRQ